MDRRWYVAQLKGGRERLAMRGLEEQGFESYYPQMQVTISRNGRMLDNIEPVFPSYLFLKSPPHPSCWRSINNTRGIIRLLGNDEPCALPNREMELLQHRERAGLLRHTRRRQIRAGDVVEFRCGTFVGLQGICQWTKRERVAVLLQILGGANVVLSPRDWLKVVVA